jgi:RNA polymerase sigma factor (sigma-70 family)
MTRENPEHTLLRQAQAGDYDAFEELYDGLYPVIYRFVNRLVGGGDEVDDILQLTFIALYRNLHRIDPVENLRPYVFKIARNRCTDALRSQGRYEITELVDNSAYPSRIAFASKPQRPEDSVHWLLVMMEVREVMQKLPELQRQTLILYAEENLSINEIALVMETQPGTVKSRLHHARKMLRRLLHPETQQAIGTLFETEETQQQELRGTI